MEHPHQRPDDQVVFRTDADEFPGSRRAQRRLSRYDRSMFQAWNSLDLFDRAAAEEYLERPLNALAGGDKQMKDKILTVVLGFSLVAVEADREQRE